MVNSNGNLSIRNQILLFIQGSYARFCCLMSYSQLPSISYIYIYPIPIFKSLSFLPSRPKHLLFSFLMRDLIMIFLIYIEMEILVIINS